MEKAHKRIPPQNLPTNPVLMPILGRVVLDSLRRRSPLVLLLQNKLEHPMMPSLGLSFSPFFLMVTWCQERAKRQGNSEWRRTFTS